MERPACRDALQDAHDPRDGVLRGKFEEDMDMVLFHRYLLDPEPELLRNGAKRLLDPPPHVGVCEDPSALRARDQMVLAIVLRMATRSPPHAGILSHIRTATKATSSDPI